MIFKLATKGFRVSEKFYEHIVKHLEKIIQSLPNTQEDLIVFRIVLKKNLDMYRPSRAHSLHHRDYSDIKPSLSHYEGTITFRFSKKHLYVHFRGRSVGECIDNGFGLIFRELEKFKALHFSSESEYPNKNSIRLSS